MKALFNLALSAVFMCTSISSAWAQMDDDLYALPISAKERQEKKNAIAERNNARKQAQTDILRHQELTERAQQAYYERENYGNPTESETILVDNIDEALARRIDAMNFRPSESSALRDIQEQYAVRLQRQFNPDLYNIIIINDKMWVEPKYITSLFANSNDASVGANDYMKKLKRSSSFNSGSSIKSYFSNDYNYWNNGHYGSQYPMSYYMGYPSGSWYPNGSWGPSGWGITWGANWGYYWGNSWNAPWYSPWYNPWGSGYYNPWYGPIHGPGWPGGGGHIVVVNRRPVIYGNTINGNNGIIRHNYPQSNRQNTYGNGSSRGAYDAGFGRGQGSYNQPQRPASPQNTQPVRQNYEPSRPISAPSPGSSGGGGFGGGYTDTGGGRRR